MTKRGQQFKVYRGVNASLVEDRRWLWSPLLDTGLQSLKLHLFSSDATFCIWAIWDFTPTTCTLSKKGHSRKWTAWPALMAKRMALVNASWLMCWGMFKKPEFLILWAGFEQPHFLVKLKSSWASFRHSASSFFDSVEFVPIFEAFGPSTSPYGSSKGGFATPKWLGQVLRPRCGLVFGTRMCLGNCFQVHKVQRIGYSKASIVNLLIEPWMSFSRWLVPERGHFHFSQPKRHMIFDLYWFMMIFLYQSPAPFDAWCFEFPSGAQPPTGLGPGWGRKSVTKRKVSSV